MLDFLGLRQLSFDFGDEPDFVHDAPKISEHLRAALSVNDRVVVITAIALPDLPSRPNVVTGFGQGRL